MPVTGEPAKAQLQEPVTPLLSTIPPASGSLGADSGQVSFPRLRGHPCDLPGRRTLESKQPLEGRSRSWTEGLSVHRRLGRSGQGRAHRISGVRILLGAHGWGPLTGLHPPAQLLVPGKAGAQPRATGAVFPPLLCRREGGPAQEDEGGRPFAPSLRGTGLPARGWQAWAPGGFGRRNDHSAPTRVEATRAIASASGLCPLGYEETAPGQDAFIPVPEQRVTADLPPTGQQGRK